MLNNLVSELESEAQADETKQNKFTAWANGEIETTTASVSRLNGQISETSAVLSTLRSQAHELQTSVTSLQGQIDQEQSQVNVATDRRNTEHAAFTTEQANFEAAITATNRAVEILAAHYGDGAPTEAAKPSWMSLVEKQMQTVRQASRGLHSASKHSVRQLGDLDGVMLVQMTHGHRHMAAQGSAVRNPMNDRYQDSSGEALGIVDQIRELSNGFSDDKQTAVEDEERLLGLYNRLMEDKTTLLNQLTTERDDQQSRLTVINQEIAEEEGELHRAQQDLSDAQGYLSQTQNQLRVGTDAYNVRQADRRAETQAVNQAKRVLESFGGAASLVELAATHRVRHGAAHAHARAHHRHLRAGRSGRCGAQCRRAASLLRARAAVMHSQLLQAAATAAGGVTSLSDVVSSIEGIVQQLEHEQEAEGHHKDWCQEQKSNTNTHIAEHSAIVDQLTAVLANLVEVIREKKDALVQNQNSITEETEAFAALTRMREDAKQEFERNLEETTEAMTALNQAIDILAKFYASQSEGGASFAQTDPNNGKQVVNMITEVRDEFAEAKKHLEENEASAVSEYETARALHTKMDADLHAERNTLSVELQTAEQAQSTNTEDKHTEVESVAAARQYLARVSSSCGPLLENFDRRKELRSQEKEALEDAIKVLKAQ